MAPTHAIILAVIAVSFSLVEGMAKPNFCRGYDCPEFSTQQMNGYELRSYPATTWVGTSAVSRSSNSATDGMFWKLYRYISGDNVAGMRTEMTAPAITRVQALGNGMYKYTMMFYLIDNNPPAPSASDVNIITLPARDVYVRTFYKWWYMADNDDFTSQANSLRTAVNDESLYDARTYYQVGYSSPYWPFRKHHEVWLDSA